MKKVEKEDILRYKFLSNVEYAPGGQAAAFVVSYANKEDNTYEGDIWVYENGKVRQLTALHKERSFYWEDEEHILFAAARSEKEKKQAKEAPFGVTNFYRIHIHGGEAKQAFRLPISVADYQKVDENTLLLLGEIDVRYPDYYKLSAKEQTRIAESEKEEKDYEVFTETPFWFNGAGVVNGKRQAMFLYDVKSQKLQRISEPKVDVACPVVLDGKIFFIGSDFDCIRPMSGDVYSYDLKSGETKCLCKAESFCFYQLINAHEKLWVIGSPCDTHGLNQNAKFYTLEEGRLVEQFDPKDSLYNSVGSDCRLGGGRQERMQDQYYYVSTRRNAAGLYCLNDAFEEKPILTEEGSVDSFDVKEDGSEILLIGMFEQKLQELYRYDEKRGMRQITHFNDGMLRNRYVAKPEKITVQSEGVDIDGWVLKPYDYDEGKKYPAIFDVHGGPKTVYCEVFYHEMQYWASQGYFVFFCNPTGSDGRGDDFADIRGKYGTIDYKNLMDFMDAVLKNYPQIDEKRVGETGGSYGGFMTNWIVGHTDRFACAATQRSISNWISFYGISDIGPDFSMDQTGGDIEENIAKMWEHSPLKYASKVKTPLLFIHSDEDYRCPMSQGIQFYTALAQRGVPVRMCLFHGENHELSRSGKPTHRLRRLTEITDWMEKYLK
ncbi:MAG: S9 family peptidase [Lachnospiraceae bacterium]|jgi:dipeptidyl aminopeptidase/acylaminoacyl peptidase|nr:S9 family peptidase [Lachnospiraceae bacterium]